ncbi:Charged multivesicular body protein, putative [Perkinsus marinus ATCC 50983]|uniref:Charged multivesicular body protein, putative n=1 Tax=Perkinsus marinus (strain ATCC 50983 / TXsc) TaxID=423536 RepID=C5K7B4_PERM5|nr:Charged multivesicular body protein, putative [Perkinsus marinus ATCC 50983]EER19449.1 Charged multivesicular body protein, putative [Perkinsus marinus ATCC 50983]|eukprot:XP_002787653.1 Charged multivesicular body protein, putative [Perkinsus marinus ATCC 50983]
MGSLFSSSRHRSSSEERQRRRKPVRTNDNDRAILDLKVQRDQLDMHKRKLRVQVGMDEQAARRCIREKNKQVALLALRKKKHHELLLDETEGYLVKVAELIGSVEMARVQADVVSALASGTKALKDIQKEIGGVEYVDQLLQDNAEAQAEMAEISSALTNVGVPEDDAECLAELERINHELAVDVSSGLPTAPKTPLPEIPPELPQVTAQEAKVPSPLAQPAT